MWSLNRVEFADIDGWATDDHRAALDAFIIQKSKPDDEIYRCGALGLDPKWFEPIVEKAARLTSDPQVFFEQNFVPFKLENSERKRGHVTGFYEPELAARLSPSTDFNVPLLRKPDDLIAINDQNRPPHLDSTYRFGRYDDVGSIVEYFDRSEIETGALNKADLALAYVQDPIEAFFIHIQGAARLRLEDGRLLRVTFDGKSGQPFTGIGKLLVARGEIAQADISMQSIKKWLYDHPDQATHLMHENRSYIFFKKVTVEDESKGPIAAAKVPLSAGRSLAVDRLLHSFSTPIFINADHVNGKSFSRLMIAQETGTAIVGAARGDIFFGSGDDAGELAGGVNSVCDFTLLVPRDAPFDPNGVKLP